MTTSFADDIETLRKPLEADSIVEAIGRVAMEWSHLEMLVEYMIWGMADLSQGVERTLTTHVNNQIRLDTVLTIARWRYKDHADSLDKIEEIIMEAFMNKLIPFPQLP